MPPLPMSSRISSCGNLAASSAILGGFEGDAFGSVTVSNVAPIFKRQTGHNPAKASLESGVPHCGQFEVMIFVGGTGGAGCVGEIVSLAGFLTSENFLSCRFA